MTNLLVTALFTTTILLFACHSSGEDAQQAKQETPMPPPCKGDFRVNLALGIESGIGSLQWCTVPEATEYIVEQSDGERFASAEEVFRGYTWLYKVGAAKDNQIKHYFRVRAVKDGETIALSNAISFP